MQKSQAAAPKRAGGNYIKMGIFVARAEEGSAQSIRGGEEESHRLSVPLVLNHFLL